MRRVRHSATSTLNAELFRQANPLLFGTTPFLSAVQTPHRQNFPNPHRWSSNISSWPYFSPNWDKSKTVLVDHFSAQVGNHNLDKRDSSAACPPHCQFIGSSAYHKSQETQSTEQNSHNTVNVVFAHDPRTFSRAAPQNPYYRGGHRIDEFEWLQL